MSYVCRLYVPSKDYSEGLCRDNFQPLREAKEREQEILKYWNTIKITDLSTSVDREDHVVEADRIDVRCTVNLGGAPAELFYVELFYMPSNNDSFKIMPMKLQNTDRSLAYYECVFETEGYGLQSMNVRIKPANETVQDLHPELIKWKE